MSLKLGIDISVLAHIAFRKTESPNYVWTIANKTKNEVKEFAINFAKIIYYYNQRFLPTELEFLMDGPDYWRKAIYGPYYKANGKIWKEIRDLPPVETIEDGRKIKYNPKVIVYYMFWDKKYYSVYPSSIDDKFIIKKLLKADIIEFQIKLDDKIATPVAYDVAPKEITELFPTYKGDRATAAWDFKTSRAEFKQLMHAQAKQLAKTLGARVIVSEKAEADDCAFVMHEDNSAENVIFITTDSDWSQMLRKGMFLQIFNPATREFVECSQDKANCDLAIKIMAGDKSDSIGALSLKGDKATLPVPSKKAKKLNKTELLYEEHGKGIFKFLGDFADPAPLARNYTLIFLANCPKSVQKDIRRQFARPPSSLGDALRLEQYGLTKEDALSLRMEAEQDRTNDIENGFYEAS